MKQRAPLACVLGTVGIGLLIRGLSNMPMARLLGLDSRHGMDMEQMSRSSAPVRRQQNQPRREGHDGSRGRATEDLESTPAAFILEYTEQVL